jgi:tripartite-type tricarboxylate transporter receptor subunit TctC
LTSGPVFAQQAAYPSRPVELWCGFSAGSGTDSHARLIALYLEKELGQSVIVVNKDGAGGIAMWTELAHTAPDGYTLGIINYPGLAAKMNLTKLTFDPMTDIRYIGNATADAVTLAVSAKSPYKTLEDVIAAAKANPGKLSVGTTGRGSQDHLTALSIEKETGAKFKYVAFPGNNEGINAILGGHLDMMTMSVSTGASFYKSGQIDMLAIGMDERDPEFPKVPTFNEKKINLFGGGALNYKALGAPGKLPDDIAAKLSAALVAVEKNPEFIERVKAMGSFAYYMNGTDFLQLAKTHAALAKEFLGK